MSLQNGVKPIIHILSFVILILPLSCNDKRQGTTMETDLHYKELFIQSERLKIQYLDWGGKGPALVLIPGLGDTPFLFDSLAQSLRNHFHVLGYSRRGHAKSVTIDTVWDNNTLVGDLKLLIDWLKIDKAHLLGWSMGGNEISGFAAEYPDRVGKLIYFESGYDLSDQAFKDLQDAMPEYAFPGKEDMPSLDAYRKWYHRFWFGDMEWNQSMESNLQASVNISSDGSVTTIPDSRTLGLIMQEVMKYHRPYEKILSPALVIYSRPFFHIPEPADPDFMVYKDMEDKIADPWRESGRKRIKAEMKNVRIVDAPAGTHTSFLYRSHDFLVQAIRSFLTEQNESD